MARTIERLTALQCANAKPPKGKRRLNLTDGGNLRLQVERAKDGQSVTRSWLFAYELDGERHWTGLGPLDTVSLAEARDEAKRLRKMLLAGDDPLEAKRAEKERKRIERQERAAEQAKRKSFAECVTSFLDKHSDGWRNAKHRAQWKSTLTTYANPVLGDLFVNDIETPHIVKVLDPIWNVKHETARRVLGRVERVLNYAKASGYRTGDNPAKWTGHLKDLLPSNGKTAGHHSAVPFDEMGAFMAELRARDLLSARALEFTILTAARTGEAIGATWSEFDVRARTWIIPPERMKGGKEHRVPLCQRAVDIVRALDRYDDRVFPLSNMAMLQLLRGMRPGCTTHGMRSAFRDWCAEMTNYPNHVVEQALAHAIGDKVEAAYRRGDLFAKRRRLMDEWARYCSKPPVAAKGDANVVPIGQKAGA